MSECWLLLHDTTHLVAHGVSYDLRVDDAQPGRTLSFSSTRRAPPPPYTLRGNVAASHDTDLPMVREGWPAMTRRLYDVLCAVGPMPEHVFHPAFVEAVPGGETRDDIGIVHLLDHQGTLDRTRAEFDDIEDLPGRVRLRRMAVAPFAPNPVPAVFRLSACPQPLLCSNAAREGIEAAGMMGCRFVPPEQWM